MESSRPLAVQWGTWLAKLRALPSALWQLEARVKGIQCSPDVLFLGRPLLSRAADSLLEIGAGVKINSALRANPLGCSQPSVLRTMAPGARLVIKSKAGMSSTVIIAGKEVVIGEDTIIGAGAMILDNDMHALEADGTWGVEYAAKARPVVIGRGVFIGARAIILKGVTIGDGSIIGAGAVVTLRDIPPGSVVAGNPAQIVPR